MLAFAPIPEGLEGLEGLAQNFDGYRIEEQVPAGRGVLAALRKQLQICDSAPVSLTVHSFFKTIPVVIVPEEPGQPGLYRNGHIELKNRAFARNQLLKNEGEFFAVTASICLYGDIPRPPYNIENIRRHLPVCADYLQNLFARL